MTKRIQCEGARNKAKYHEVPTSTTYSRDVRIPFNILSLSFRSFFFFGLKPLETQHSPIIVISFANPSVSDFDQFMIEWPVISS